MARASTRTLRLPVFIHAPPEKVFAAVTEPQLLTRWLMDRATFSAHKGAMYAFTWEGGPTHTGTILDFVPGKRFTISWSWPGHETLKATKLRLSLVPKEGGTVLTFTHSGFGTTGPWKELYEGSIRGWTYFMMNLKSVLETEHDLRYPHDW
ncbi:MAG: SRPBCC domain-containing protein [Thermoplasmata archaeon]|nr:SRPBCC domain-containing protein [Thermoplasmata archaeon]